MIFGGVIPLGKQWSLREWLHKGNTDQMKGKLHRCITDHCESDSIRGKTPQWHWSLSKWLQHWSSSLELNSPLLNSVTASTACRRPAWRDAATADAASSYHSRATVAPPWPSAASVRAIDAPAAGRDRRPADCWHGIQLVLKQKEIYYTKERS